MQRKQAVRTLIGMTAAATVFGLGACSGGDSSGPSSEATSQSQETSAPASSAPASSASSASSSSGQSAGKENAGLLKAGRTALDKVSDSTLISIETEHNDSQWEIQVVKSDGTEHEMNTNIAGDKIVSGPNKKSEDSDDRAKHRDRVKAAKIDYREAAQKINQARSGRITELNIDTDNSTTVWEADVKKSGTKYEVSIDAATGKVIENEED